MKFSNVQQIQKVVVDGKAKNLEKKCLKLNPYERPRRFSNLKFFNDAKEVPSFTPPHVSPPSQVPPNHSGRFRNVIHILTFIYF